MNESYSGYEIIGKVSDHNEIYLAKIKRFVDASSEASTRCVALRFDLRFPKTYTGDEQKCISKFIDSLRAKLSAFEARKRKLNQRIYPNRLGYLWVRENAGEAHDHFHFVITLNNDAFMSFGNLNSSRTNMASRIHEAWISSLSLADTKDGSGLVHYCKNGVYKLDRNAKTFQEDYGRLFFRLSYLAKKKTKVEQRRTIGSSQVRRQEK